MRRSLAAARGILFALAIAGLCITAQRAQADDAIDPSLIPDGTYPAHVDRVIDNRHLEVTMQGTLKVFLASGRADVRFNERVKANDDLLVTLADGEVVTFVKK